MQSAQAHEIASQVAAPAGRPHLDRTDIRFHNLSPSEVMIELTVRNNGEEPSAQTFAVVQAAPLGVFVPSRPLTVLPVPPLQPGQSTTVRVVVPAAEVAPLGPPDRVAPRQLITALGLPDDRSRPGATGPTLPADLMKMLGQGGMHWAGNLNVFIGGKPVERHLAQALRVYAGRVNAAMFVVGCGRDGYLFRLQGSAVDWDATLYDLSGCSSLKESGAEIAENTWVEIRQTAPLMLTLQPPADCGAGTVEVHVTQRSTGQTAVVEFSLDPAAAGPGCYVV